MYVCMYVRMYVCMYVCMSGRLRERSGQSVPEATKESVVLEEGTIEELTERRRMTVEERGELPFSCTHHGRHFSQPRYAATQVCDNA